MSPVLLNIGCGNKLLPKPWINVDHVPPSNLDMFDVNFEVGDVTDLKFSEVDHILASHLFEHFPPVTAIELLGKWKSTLKPNGSIALEMPDLYKCCKNVVTAVDTNDAEFYQTMGVFGLYGDPHAAIANPSMRHMWGWLPTQLKDIAEALEFGAYRLEVPTQKPWGAQNRDFRIVLFNSKDDKGIKYYEYPHSPAVPVQVPTDTGNTSNGG